MSAAPSIRRTVLKRVLVIALLYTLCLFLVVDAEINSTLVSVRTNILTSRLWEVGSYLSRDAHKKLYLDIPQARSDFYAAPGIDYIIRDRKGNLLFHSRPPWINFSPAKVPGRGEINEFTFTGPGGDTFMGQSGWVDFENVPFLVQVTQSEDDASQFPLWLSRVFLYKVVLLGIPFLCALLASIVYSVRQSLGPINHASREAQEINFVTHGARLKEGGVPEEVRPLVEAFNMALARLDAGIVAQKEFTANAAHELRTPLSILQAHINLLADRDLREKLGGDVEKMGRLVAQLLAAARLEYPGNLPLKRTDLSAVVREVCLAIWPLMLQQSLVLDVAGAEDPLWLEGNHDALYRALRNVLENAVHYSPKGGAVRVVVAPAGRGAEIRISDNGPGVAPQDRERIFERFWRKDSSNSTGAGLGLYIVRTVMKLHGGSVHVEEGPGGGSLFVLSLPALLPAEAESSKA